MASNEKKSLLTGSAPEFRLTIKKKSALKKSNFLQSLINQNLNADIAKSPYTLDLQSAGLRIKTVKSKQKNKVMFLKR